MGPRHLALFDKTLVVCAFAILSIGLMMVASSSIVIAERLYDQPFYFLIRQLIYLGLGLGSGLIVVRIHTRFWEKISPLLLLLSLILLILVLIPGIGRSVNGSMRWLWFGQVSEFVKLGVIIYLASYINRYQVAVREEFAGFLKPLLIVGLLGILLLRQPDFGATIVIMATALGMLFLAGVKLSRFAMLFGGISLGFLGLALSSPYRLARLTSFLNPWADQFNSGYQLTQSLIAFGRGGYWGNGLGESIQKLFYLPEAHNDFILAVIAEELGLVGLLLLMSLFAVFIARSLLIARAAQTQERGFCAYLAYGISLWFTTQIMINFGVNIGLLPTKGLTLPLVSYGGSSLLVSCVAIALLIRIDHETRWHHVGVR